MTAAPNVPGEFLRCVVGSRLYGVETETSDNDLMGVFVEDPQFVTGLDSLEQITWRSQPEGAPSGPDDIDLTVYGLQKFMRLALDNNPTILSLFFVPTTHRLIDSEPASALREMLPCILSRKAAGTYRGFMKAQRKRMERHPEVIDSKYLGHIVRIGLQGEELMLTGNITLPMKERDRAYVRAIRSGEVAAQEALRTAESLETDLERLEHTVSFQAVPDRKAVNDFLHEIYLKVWR